MILETHALRHGQRLPAVNGRLDAYNAPVENTARIPSFLFRRICNLDTTDSGSNSM